MVYWRLARYIRRRPSDLEAVSEELTKVLDGIWDVQLRIRGLMREIEQRVRRGEYHGASLPFDPRNHGDEDLTAGLGWGQEHGEPPPAYMYQATGAPFEG
jgi:hypothetical protein